MKRLCLFAALVCEILAAAGFGEIGLGTIHLSLIAAGLAFYILAQI
jgi:hypothetical protein